MYFKLIVLIALSVLVGFSQGENEALPQRDLSILTKNVETSTVTQSPVTTTETPKTPSTLPPTTTSTPLTTPTTTTNPTPPTTTSTTSTTPPPKTTTPTPPPKTTTPTPPPKTTTPTPPPTTTTSTTPTPPPTTTPAPNATTTSAPSTTPLPSPQCGKWIVAASNVTCIVVQMAVQLNVTYPTKDNKTTNILLDVPTDNTTTASGTCSNTTQTLTLKWGTGNVLEVSFEANRTSNDFNVNELSLTINATDLPGVAVNQTVLNYKDEGVIFKTPLQMSYKCDKSQKLNLTSADKQLVAVVDLSHTQLEAFREKSTDVFGAAQDCESLDTPDIVPIAVGCALALLVLIVLAAYLIGRRRSQNRGYLSIDDQ